MSSTFFNFFELKFILLILLRILEYLFLISFSDLFQDRCCGVLALEECGVRGEIEAARMPFVSQKINNLSSTLLFKNMSILVFVIFA